MALEIGNEDPPSGMSKAIYDQFDNILMLPDEKNKLKSADLENIRNGWRKLAHAIAKGIVPYIKANMEIAGIQTSGSVTTTVTGTVTGTTVTGTGTGTVTTNQSGPTTGHVL
ncbi:MAG: hypothetical protein ACREOI_11870 [bacterium]